MIFMRSVNSVLRELRADRPPQSFQRAPQFWLKDHWDRDCCRRHDTAKSQRKATGE